QQDQRSADSQVHSAESKSPASAAFTPTIFNVLAGSARCPFHGVLPAARLDGTTSFFLNLMNIRSGIYAVDRQLPAAVTFSGASFSAPSSSRIFSLAPSRVESITSISLIFAASSRPPVRAM